MNDYALALKAYLDQPERSQKKLAEDVGISQPSVLRYARGDRFPEIDLARRIEAATGGEVSISIWQKAAMARLGITEPVEADSSAAAA